MEGTAEWHFLMRKRKTVYYWHHLETGRPLVMEIKREIPTISQSLGGLRFDT